MGSLDTLYYSLAIGFLILVGFTCFALYQLAQTLRSLKQVIQDVEDIAQDVKSVKESIKMGLGLIGTFLKKRR